MTNLQDLQTFLAESQMTEVLQSLNTIPWVFDFETNVLVSDLSYIDKVYTHGAPFHEQNFEELIENSLPEYRERLLEIYSHVKNGLTSHVNIEMKLKMGELHIPVWIKLDINAKEKNELGMPRKAVGCATIIQDRKEAEQVMLTAQQKAEEANLIKTNFLANMTHEFRTPLNSILGFSTIMAHSEAIEERMQCLGAIQTSGSMLIHIIEDVLELSRLEANEVELKRNLVDINQLLENVVEEAKPQRKEGVEMTYHHTETNTILQGDEKKITLVMKHLLDNSCKYTESGSIDVYCHKSSEYAVVTVTDTGKGMNEEMLRHVFDRFYKGNPYVPGTGLGMCVVKSLVSLWNGTIKVDSNEDEGTYVSFSIPLHASFFQNRTQRHLNHY